MGREEVGRRPTTRWGPKAPDPFSWLIATRHGTTWAVTVTIPMCYGMRGGELNRWGPETYSWLAVFFLAFGKRKIARRCKRRGRTRQ